MLRLMTLLLVALLAALARPAGAQAKAELKNTDGRAVGTVTLTDTPFGVLVHASLTGLPTGTHAFHFHQTGVCESPFTSAGGHFNPTSRQHGIQNPMGMHAGDLPNIEVPSGGNLVFDVLATGVTLEAGANGLFKEGGTSIVVHAGGDDYRTGPTGTAAARIACGVVTKAQ